MTDILFHEAGVTARELAELLRPILAGLPTANATRLADELDSQTHDTPSLVLTGQYSSGKSTLIKALTDGSADVVIDSDISTDSVQHFLWEGVLWLVDTPGVQAGVASHDAKAEQALRAADLVLFTVTVELFDDRLIEHLHHVLTELDKSKQIIIVLTKASTMVADTGIRDATVQDALDVHSDVPWIECDAEYYLKGIAQRGSTSHRSEEYIERSRIQLVKELINRVARERGQLSRFSQPLQQIISIVAEAHASLIDDPDEASALIVLARQRSALSARRERLHGWLDRHRAEFRSRCISIAEGFADQVERHDADGGLEGSVLEAAFGDLNSAMQEATEHFNESVQATVAHQFEDLISELREIEASPHAQHVIALAQANVADAETPEINAGGGQYYRVQSGRPDDVRSWVSIMSTYLSKFRTSWDAGDGVKLAAGGNAHKIVLDVGHIFGKKFKPWQAVKWANGIGKAAEVGGWVLSIGLEVHQVVREERAELAAERARITRRRAFVNQILAQCDEIADRSVVEAKRVLDNPLDAEIGQIDGVTRRISGTRKQRDDTAMQLGDIRQRALAMLAVLGKTTTIASLEAPDASSAI